MAESTGGLPVGAGLWEIFEGIAVQVCPADIHIGESGICFDGAGVVRDSQNLDLWGEMPTPSIAQPADFSWASTTAMAVIWTISFTLHPV